MHCRVATFGATLCVCFTFISRALIAGQFHPHHNYKGEDWANYDYPQSEEIAVKRASEPEGTIVLSHLVNVVCAM